MSDEDGLFELDPAAVVKPKAGPLPLVAKTFRAFAPRSDAVAAAVAG